MCTFSKSSSIYNIYLSLCPSDPPQAYEYTERGEMHEQIDDIQKNKINLFSIGPDDLKRGRLSRAYSGFCTGGRDLKSIHFPDRVNSRAKRGSAFAPPRSSFALP